MTSHVAARIINTWPLPTPTTLTVVPPCVSLWCS